MSLQRNRHRGRCRQSGEEQKQGNGGTEYHKSIVCESGLCKNIVADEETGNGDSKQQNKSDSAVQHISCRAGKALKFLSQKRTEQSAVFLMLHHEFGLFCALLEKRGHFQKEFGKQRSHQQHRRGIDRRETQ